MTIKREYRHLIIECDDCGGNEMFDKDTPFEQAIEEWKDNGGKITKTDDGWKHWCGQPCEPGDEDDG